ncbi:hypothetical protein [Spiroplasma citri]|uniref:Putative transmembrane protein n=1 Tax=Spiroplasma citri TaxID=2133 RepID=Q3ZVH5_SPICI|nr:hypothetical protein [Spiroplasma citri]QED25650.1 hypothetical protein FRX96_10240 [Spiroplasma citri]QIA68017.1 hypothetical protein GMI18_10720 [Spiroplasma citri]QIA71793.1 hypothetical protein GL981_10875 [Spiroplasma citri]QIA71870.1 hypothetical protein GL981_11265 [Spiroplasma citri]CAI93819.1 putative transmembrane protein [Spiroplasma citri]
MKKLLSLLSVLTISGTAIQTTIAASPYQKEQEKEYYQDTINYEFFLREPNKIFFTFSKKRWNEIKELYHDIYIKNKKNIKYQKKTFNINFIDILNNGVWQDWRLNSNSYNAISEKIIDNFDLINNIIEKTKQDYYQLNTNDEKSYFSFFPSTKGVPYSFTKEIRKKLNKAIILLSSGIAGAAIGIIGNIINKYSVIIGAYKALNINFVILVGWVIRGATPLIIAGAATGIIIGVVIVGLQIYYFVQ